VPVIGRPARNVFSRTVLHLGSLSIVLHPRRSYRVDLWCGGSFSDIVFAFTVGVPVRREGLAGDDGIRGIVSDYPRYILQEPFCRLGISVASATVFREPDTS
jgi:hypothetical protein